MLGTFIVISGPSGSGKSTLMENVLKRVDNVYFSISSTSRKIRNGEKDGVNYHFISEEKFKKDIEDGYFLEWALVHGNYYGTSLRYVQKALNEGKIVILDVDVQGHKIIRGKLADKITSIFITTPNGDILRRRLEERNTDTSESIERRISNAKDEMERLGEYDFLLVNDDFESTFEKFVHIIKASQNRVKNVDIQKFISSWKNK